MIAGQEGSETHGQNGMTHADMVAAKLVANRLNEVIIFRSTGPWSKRWLKRAYPSKNFHVKGKSSDWGPHAGLVPYDGTYSKVGYDAAKAAKGTHANDDGLASGFAGREVLVLTSEQIDEQVRVPEGTPPRNACVSQFPVPDSRDLLVTAERSGDRKAMSFRAFERAGRYIIHVYPPASGIATNPYLLLSADPRGVRSVPLFVMTSNEVGAEKPMTGDYDLFAVCPLWADYGSQSSRAISKPGINLAGRGAQTGLTFEQGVGMDNVMDPRLSTMGRGPGMRTTDYVERQAQFRKALFTGRQGPIGMKMASLQNYLDETPWMEHGDMGNLTPRILRCINELNAQMGATGDRSGLRRVHHNAESHRFRLFGALTEKDMNTRKEGDAYGDGFPLTSFHPAALDTSSYLGVCTIENLAEFRIYAAFLKQRGFFVPRNLIWGA